MQRVATKSTRDPSADEKRFHAFVKEQPCVTCGRPGPSILHHCEGATFKHNKVLIGHWFVIPLCYQCDEVITHGSRRTFRERFGPQCDLWISTATEYIYATGLEPPEDVFAAIEDWGK